MDGFDKRFKSNYDKLVLQNYHLFEAYKCKTFELDQDWQLHYRHEGTWIIVAISKQPGVSLYEVMNFIDRFKQVMSDIEGGAELDEIQAEEAEEHFRNHKGQVSELIYKWNMDPENRDKTYKVFKELMETKDEMIRNLALVGERGELLDEGLIKAEGLAKQAIVYRKNAKKAKK